MSGFDGYFSPEQRRDIAKALIAAYGDYERPQRSIFWGAVSADIRIHKPPLIGDSLIQLLTDLGMLNDWERVTDGSVPLLSFLRAAVHTAPPIEALEAAVLALRELESRVTGAPKLDIASFPEIKERIIGRDDMVSFGFVESALRTAVSVAKLEVPRYDDGVAHRSQGNQTIFLGTGWMLGPRLLITNHHVVNARPDGEKVAGEADLRRQAAETTIRFDYNYAGVQSTPRALSELICWNADLDYAVCRLAEDGPPSLPLMAENIPPLSSDNPMPLNIVQHPDGNPKKFAIRNNLAISVSEREMRYFTDTNGGSSGAPVLNDDWQVVALHRGATYAKGVKYQGRDTAYVNLGTRISAILADIRTRCPGLAI